MSIQPTRTPAQQEAACPTCDADPTCAPGRYCLATCYCNHPACPAFDATKVLIRVRESRAAQADLQIDQCRIERSGNRRAPAGNRGP